MGVLVMGDEFEMGGEGGGVDTTLQTMQSLYVNFVDFMMSTSAFYGLRVNGVGGKK